MSDWNNDVNDLSGRMDNMNVGGSGYVPPHKRDRSETRNGGGDSWGGSSGGNDSWGGRSGGGDSRGSWAPRGGSSGGYGGGRGGYGGGGYGGGDSRGGYGGGGYGGGDSRGSWAPRGGSSGGYGGRDQGGDSWVPQGGRPGGWSAPAPGGAGGDGPRVTGYGGGFGGSGGGSRGGWSGPSARTEMPAPRRERGVGIWDPEQGHVPAPKDDALEAQLFKSAHVATGINFSKYDDIPIEASGNNVPKGINSFDEAKLHSLLIENIELASYTTPTPVQKYSLPIVEAGRDLMACAQTGSGKTAGFLFPILNELFIKGPPPNRDTRGPACPVALILSPTRELTSQIYDEARRFAYRSWVRPVVVYGGVPMREQMMGVRRGVDLMVATPGRLLDFIERGMVSLKHVKYLILDEADRMLDMGFEPQIRRIVEEEDCPAQDQRCTLMFSATFPREIQYLARDFLGDYIFLSVGRVGAASENVTQRVIEVAEHEKHEVLLDILTVEPASATNLTLIFVETKKGADMLAHFLYDNNFPATAIHGDRDQRERERALQSFRTARTPILVATAVAARGLDIPNVTHVINYDLPSDIDDYVHRIGRTGRAGNTGVATAFFDQAKNFNVVRDLITILRDANQEVPDFLEQVSRYSGGGGRGGRGGRGRGGGFSRGNTRDFRKEKEYNNYQPPARDSWGGGGDSWGPPPSSGQGGYW